MLKYGLIHDNSLYNDLKKYSTEKDFNRLENIEKCIQIKVEISEKDLQDVGERMLLNFGHTFGHAIEGYLLETSPISHGHAVGIGMCAESYISMQRGLLLKEDFDDIQEILIRTYPFIEFEESAIDGILELMYNDKKNEDGKILSVLLTSIGSASFRNEIIEDEVRLALKHLSMLSASSK